MVCGQPPPGEEGGAKKSGDPLGQIVRTGFVGLCRKELYSGGPQSTNARSTWAPTRHNSRESSRSRDAPNMYAVRIVFLLHNSEFQSNSSVLWTLTPFRMIPRRSTCGVESAERLPQRIIRVRKCLGRPPSPQGSRKHHKADGRPLRSIGRGKDNMDNGCLGR